MQAGSEGEGTMSPVRSVDGLVPRRRRLGRYSIAMEPERDRQQQPAPLAMRNANEETMSRIPAEDVMLMQMLQRFKHEVEWVRQQQNGPLAQIPLIGGAVTAANDATPDTFWVDLTQDQKEDRETALSAFVGLRVSAEPLPDCFKRDRSFFLDAVAKNSFCWYNIPEEYQGDEAFARNIRHFCTEKLVADVLEKIPSLRHDLELWDTIISSMQYFWCSGGVFLHHLPTAVWPDRELMLTVCEHDPNAFEYLDQSFALDKDFWQRLLARDAGLLGHIPSDLQLTNPELVIDHLPQYCAVDYQRWEMYGLHMVLEQVRHSPSYVQVWFTSGGVFEDHLFPTSMQDDEQIFLWIAEYAKSDDECYNSFEHCSPRLTGSLEFMTKAVAIRPKLFWVATDELEQSTNLLLKAFAESMLFAYGFFEEYRCHEGHWPENYLEDLCAHVEQRLGVYDSFLMFLFGMSLPAQESKCTLTVLNQGTETSLVYKKKIAEYVGVPMTDVLRMYRRALPNIRLALNFMERFGHDDLLKTPWSDFRYTFNSIPED